MPNQRQSGFKLVAHLSNILNKALKIEIPVFHIFICQHICCLQQITISYHFRKRRTEGCALDIMGLYSKKDPVQRKEESLADDY